LWSFRHGFPSTHKWAINDTPAFNTKTTLVPFRAIIFLFEIKVLEERLGSERLGDICALMIGATAAVLQQS